MARKRNKHVGLESVKRQLLDTCGGTIASPGCDALAEASSTSWLGAYAPPSSAVEGWMPARPGATARAPWRLPRHRDGSGLEARLTHFRISGARVPCLPSAAQKDAADQRRQRTRASRRSNSLIATDAHYSRTHPGGGLPCAGEEKGSASLEGQHADGLKKMS